MAEKALNLRHPSAHGVLPLGGRRRRSSRCLHDRRAHCAGGASRRTRGAAAAAVVVGVVTLAAARRLPVLGPRQLPQAPGRVGPQVVTGPVAAVVAARGVCPQGAHQHLDDHIVTLQGRQVEGREAAATRGAHVEPQPPALGEVVHQDEFLVAPVLGQPVQHRVARDRVAPQEQPRLDLQQLLQRLKAALSGRQYPRVLPGLQA